MGKFNPPNNVKQIGSFDQKDAPDVKIYIEDYAYTYLQQYAQSGNYNERLAFLIGKNINDDGSNIILISGAVASKYTQHDNGILNITPETWNYVYDQIDKYFKGLEVVGLMQSQPGYSSHLNEKYVSQFRNNFNKTYQTFLLCDPIENINVFHVFDQTRENLISLNGHFIYYEKNPAMNEYMIDNKEIKNPPKEQKDEPPEITLRKRQFDRIQKSNNDQRKTVNILASLSAVLFLICFIMGTGLVQNEDRISKLEKQIKDIATNNISGQLVSIDEKNDISSSEYYDKNNVQTDEVKSVFSNSSPKIVKDFDMQENVSEAENDTDNENNDDSQQNTPEQNNSPQNKNDSLDNSFEDENDNQQDNKKQSPEKASEKNSDTTKTTFSNIPKTYTVQDGDSLSGISRKIFGTSSMVNKIMELNNMEDADKIYSGKVLKIPRG